MKYFFYALIFCPLLFHCNARHNQKVEYGKPNDFLPIVNEYVQTMISEGRDVYGTKQSPLFASALNRQTLEIDSILSATKIPGVRVRDRSITGANLIHDIYLYKILYELSDITGDNIFALEADRALTYFFTNCQSAATGLMCWGEHLYWDFELEDCGYADNYDFHEATAWPFWDQSYGLAPDACWKFAISEWDHQINDHQTGDFSRHARYTRHETFSGFDFPRYAGQMIERWADAYQRTENTNRKRKEELLTAIQVLFNRMVENAALSPSGLLIAGRAAQGDHKNIVWPTSNLELARCLEKAAPVMKPSIALKMKAFALKQDRDFLNAPHRFDSIDGGFAATLDAATGLPRSRSMNKPYTSTWSSGYGYGTHAKTAILCFNRSQQLKDNHPKEAEQYKILAINVSRRYLNSVPDTNKLLKPNEFANVIELMRMSFEKTGDKEYLERAVFFANMGIDLFLNDDVPLPKASNQHVHYESITGGPSFIYQLLELHLLSE